MYTAGLQTFSYLSKLLPALWGFKSFQLLQYILNNLLQTSFPILLKVPQLWKCISSTWVVLIDLEQCRSDSFIDVLTQIISQGFQFFIIVIYCFLQPKNGIKQKINISLHWTLVFLGIHMYDWHNRAFVMVNWCPCTSNRNGIGQKK